MNATKVLELAINNDVDRIIELAKKEIREKEVKKKCNSSDVKRFKLIEKYLLKVDMPDRFRTTWIENGHQCFTNGYIAFMLKKHFDQLPKTDIPPLNLNDLIKQKTADDLYEVDVDITDVKTKLKIFKAENKANKTKRPCIYRIENSFFNAQYLIDCYTILSGKNIKFSQTKNNLAPAIIKSENGKAIICPVKPPKDKQL